MTPKIEVGQVWRCTREWGSPYCNPGVPGPKVGDIAMVKRVTDNQVLLHLVNRTEMSWAQDWFKRGQYWRLVDEQV